MRLYIPPNDANDFHTLREEMIAEETIANFGFFLIFTHIKDLYYVYVQTVK